VRGNNQTISAALDRLTRDGAIKNLGRSAKTEWVAILSQEKEDE
jgi:hypothetical protein